MSYEKETILAVDSSAVSASCCVLRGGRLVAQTFVNAGLTHSRTLMPIIDATLRAAGITADDIDFAAVSAGPGSFTGIRIGIATVKGISFTRDIPCVPVSTLSAIAHNMTGFEGYACAVMDARCGQVYTATFRLEVDIKRVTPDRAIPIETLVEELPLLKTTVWLCGDGAEICFEKLNNIPNIRIAPPFLRYQTGYGVAKAAEQAIASGEAVKPNDLTPIYLRIPQAERELKKEEKL